jgi:hypothetical protein
MTDIRMTANGLTRTAQRWRHADEAVAAWGGAALSSDGNIRRTYPDVSDRAPLRQCFSRSAGTEWCGTR